MWILISSFLGDAKIIQNRKVTEAQKFQYHVMYIIWSRSAYPSWKAFA